MQKQLAWEKNIGEKTRKNKKTRANDNVSSLLWVLLEVDIFTVSLFLTLAYSPWYVSSSQFCSCLEREREREYTCVISYNL
jgi:hypothetical protein